MPAGLEKYRTLLGGADPAELLYFERHLPPCGHERAGVTVCRTTADGQLVPDYTVFDPCPICGAPATSPPS